MIWAVTMCRDEEDIIGYTLPRMAAQVDGVIVADNRSTDDTPEILAAVAREFGNIFITDDPEPAYMQSDKMSHLARLAGERGATWVVPFDADEVWAGVDTLRGEMASVVEALLYDHVVCGTDDKRERDPLKRIVHRRPGPTALPKVACRVLPGMVIEQGNHGAHYPGDVMRIRGGMHIHHFPYRSAQQMARKARNGSEAYAAAGARLPPSAGQHWRDYGRFLETVGMSAIEEIFSTWFYSPDGTGLVHDPA